MHRSSALLLVLALGSTSSFAQNTCGTALPVVAGMTYTVDTIDGTSPPFVCGPSINGAPHSEWYIYTPTQDTALTISADLPQNFGGDTRFQVFAGGSCAYTCAGGDDDSGAGLLSVTTLNVNQGTSYYIVFDSYWSSEGFDFMLTETVPTHDAVEFLQQPLAISGWPNCVVDLNGDHLDDVVSTSITNVHVNYQLPEGGFQSVNIPTPAADHTASWSICAGDLDHNGYNDLMYGDGDGVTFMLAVPGGAGFTEMSFPEYVFCQRTNMVDLNNDGHLDAFSCHDVAANVYYLNDGNNNLSFHQGGMGETCGNYGSVFIDIDNDRDMDLFVSKCGCDPVDILYRNNGDGTFSNIAFPMGFVDYQQSWSSAWGDYDNDGDVDAMVGSSTGDYHKLMRNDGDVFTNVTPGSGFDSYSGINIEWTTHDFDNDGWLDVLGGGTILLNNGDMTFTPIAGSMMNGPIGDLNNDGFMDIVYGPTAWMSVPNENHYITINTIGTVSNWNGIGARVEVNSPLGTQIRDVKSGDGFEFMSSLNTHVGLNDDTEIYSVVVRWPSGIVNVIENPAIDTVLTVVEEVNTAVIGGSSVQELALFPNPTDGPMSLTMAQGVNARNAHVLDVSGKHVMNVAVTNNRVDVSSLQSGVYLLQVQAGDRLFQQKFTKR
jgi:hypothetical protein